MDFCVYNVSSAIVCNKYVSNIDHKRQYDACEEHCVCLLKFYTNYTYYILQCIHYSVEWISKTFNAQLIFNLK